MTERARNYALAGALSVETAELLRAVHRAMGAPGEPDEVPPRRRPMLAAAARTYGAAAACSALVARLLLAERDASAERLKESLAPQVVEFGVTTLEGDPHAEWRATVRAAAGALGELVATESAWRDAADDLGDKIMSVVGTLLGYVEELATALEAMETDGSGGLSSSV